MDPTKHVNYVLGMVLGVDDFTQEFTYLSERDRWLARDLLGYGTAWGLAVTTQLSARGPEVRVSPGVAVSPRGQLLRVTPAQCASLNDWLASRTQEVDARLPANPPPGTRLPVSIVLCYRECETDPVPIPGEPCRSEDDATASSRIADDFKLELRFDPPEQHEENALRDLVRWLRTHIQVPPSPLPSMALEDFLQALRDAVVTAPGSPPWSPSDYLLDTSPASPLAVAAEDLGRYLRAAFRVWVTELRPRWRPNWLGEAHGCTETLTPPPHGGEDCVLLAELSLPLTRELGGGPWKVAPAPARVTVDEDRRPFLAHLRLLQEWLLHGPLPEAPASSPTPPAVVAAGTVPTSPALPAPNTYNQLKAVGIAAGAVTLTFNGYQDPTGQNFQYIVKPLLVASDQVKSPVITFGGYRPNGFVLQFSDQGLPIPQATLEKLQLVLEVSRYPRG
jgi:hypothetical protein